MDKSTRFIISAADITHTGVRQASAWEYAQDDEDADVLWSIIDAIDADDDADEEDEEEDDQHLSRRTNRRISEISRITREIVNTNDAERIFSVFDINRFLLPSLEESALFDSFSGPFMVIKLLLPSVLLAEWAGRDDESLVCTMLLLLLFFFLHDQCEVDLRDAAGDTTTTMKQQRTRIKGEVTW